MMDKIMNGNNEFTSVKEGSIEMGNMQNVEICACEYFREFDLFLE